MIPIRLRPNADADVDQGIPYKYVAAVSAKAFAEAPSLILKALHRLTWAGQQCTSQQEFRKFNELLAVGYMQDQKMGVSRVEAPVGVVAGARSLTDVSLAVP